MEEEKLDKEKLNLLLQKVRGSKILRNICIALFLFVAFIVVSDAITYYQNSDKYECEGLYCYEIVNETNLSSIEMIDTGNPSEQIEIQIPNYINNNQQ